MINAGSCAGGPPACRTRGLVRTGMKRFDAAASVLLAFGLVGLGGCGDFPYKIDPFGVPGLLPLDSVANRNSGQLNYATLMRIGEAARAGGDLATAVTVFRRAAAMDTTAIPPFVAAGDALIEMGNFNEAIVAYNAALARSARDREALRGLARAYLTSGKPALAGHPLAIAFEDNPDDPKLLELIGVADDLVGRHDEAQARYRRGLELLPRDPALSLDLALSLALSGSYPEAIGILRPIATAAGSSLRERQTLALIYGLQGDRRAAEQTARLDLDPESVQSNLAYYETLRRLSPEARHRAIEALGAGGKSDAPS
jgi:Flp pilus assembly protein TadD